MKFHTRLVYESTMDLYSTVNNPNNKKDANDQNNGAMKKTDKLENITTSKRVFWEGQTIEYIRAV